MSFLFGLYSTSVPISSLSSTLDTLPSFLSEWESFFMYSLNDALQFLQNQKCLLLILDAALVIFILQPALSLFSSFFSCLLSSYPFCSHFCLVATLEIWMFTSVCVLCVCVCRCVCVCACVQVVFRASASKAEGPTHKSTSGSIPTTGNTYVKRQLNIHE